MPWTRLPKLHALACEFYADLPQHRSWTYVIWQFIFDANVGIRCRVKRKEGGRLVGVDGGKKADDWTENEIQA